jgi:GH24 family phage-related lysozyme (muramidase)
MVKEIRRTIKLLSKQEKTIAFQWIPSHVGIHGNETADLLAKKGTTLLNKHTELDFKTVKRLIKQKTQEKYLKEAITLSSKTQWQNIKSTWENNKNKPRKQAVALFRLNTGHNCLAAHLYRIKVLSYNHCLVCKQKNAIMDKAHLLLCPKLDQTSKELSKLYQDARRLME